MTSRARRVLIEARGNAVSAPPGPRPGPSTSRYSDVYHDVMFGAAVPIITDYGRDLRSWMAQPGNQVLTLPDGIYTAGALGPAQQHAANAPIPAGGADYGGWLILKAQNLGGAIVDLSATGFTAPAGNYRILFDGIAFRNGEIQVSPGTNRWRWWYCTGTFPADVWSAQFYATPPLGRAFDNVASNADVAAKALMANPFPSFIRRSNQGLAGNQAIGYGWYGCDLHDFGDDGLYVGNMDQVEIVGTKIWNISEVIGATNYDPNQAGANDWFHNDVIQSTNDIAGLTITDCCLGAATTTLGGDGGACTGFAMRDVWFYADPFISNGKPMVLYSKRTYWPIAGTVTTAGLRLINYGGSVWEWDAVSPATIVVWPATHNDPTRWPAVVGSRTLDHTTPSGVGITGGVLDDQFQILNHASNPANAWRTLHPRSSRDAFFAGNWP